MKPSPYGPLQVDRRIGSSDLYLPLMQAGVPTDLTDLTYGDCAFLGRGPADRPVTIGIERKTVPDLVQSLLTGRLNGHQLPGLIGGYEFAWILVEGAYRSDDEGCLLLPRKGGWYPLSLRGQRFQAATLDAWLLTLSLRGGARVVQTWNASGTVRWLKALYLWWTQKAWEEHHGHLALDQAMPERDAVLLIPPTIVQRIAAQLPGIGYSRAKDVSNAFPTILTMACAPAQQWKTIPGIGPVLSERVVKLIQAGE